MMSAGWLKRAAFLAARSPRGVPPLGAASRRPAAHTLKNACSDGAIDHRHGPAVADCAGWRCPSRSLAHPVTKKSSAPKAAAGFVTCCRVATHGTRQSNRDLDVHAAKGILSVDVSGATSRRADGLSEPPESRQQGSHILGWIVPVPLPFGAVCEVHESGADVRILLGRKTVHGHLVHSHSVPRACSFGLRWPDLRCASIAA
jgi:hypothetical protein